MATETKAAHTPGPWWKTGMNCVYANRFLEATPMQRAHNEPVLIAGEGADALTGTEREANALLISLSPELLAELKLAVSRFDYNPGHSDLDNEQPIHLPITLGDYRRIRSLIHRAEGK